MNKKIILAACEKDLQSIELLCAAILCTQHSVELVYFDNYIPAESLALISQTMGAHIIMLGSSTEGSSNLVEFSEQLQNHINEKTHLWMTSNKAQEKFKFMSNSQIHFFPALENLEQKLNEISQNV